MAAIHYHFGNKISLVRAALARRTTCRSIPFWCGARWDGWWPLKFWPIPPVSTVMSRRQTR